MNRKRYHYLTYTERLQIYSLRQAKVPIREIAVIIKKHVSTVYRELKRGSCTCLDAEARFVQSYSPDIAHQKFRENMAAKGPDLKIGVDHAYAEYLERRILQDGISPDAVLGEIKYKGIQFETCVSTRTLYNYIDKGLFRNLSNADLLRKGKYRKKKPKKVSKRPPRGISIEQRSSEIGKRISFGHWEMDTVYGPVGGHKRTLLVLTERLTRMEVIRPIADRTARSVVKALNSIERQYSTSFPHIFKTITVDNGSEFSDVYALQNSPYARKPRTSLYFCHPYCSSERGSNENANSIIRRYIPKGRDLSLHSSRDIVYIQNKINTMPRKVLGYSTAQEEFEKYISKINPALCKTLNIRTDY